MTYVIPNSPDAGHADLAEPDSGDFRILGNRTTGVFSGGEVTESGTPSLTLLVSAAEIVINDVPYSMPGGPVTLDASTPLPRFDLIGWYSDVGLTVLKGQPSENPVYPDFDLTLFCPTCVAYVRPNTSEVTNSYIVSKQATPHRGLRRIYATDSDVAMEFATPAKANAFKALANGTLSWVSSVLSRTADTALDWLTSLTIKQPDPAAKALVLKSAVGAVENDRVFEVQPADAATALVGIDAVGKFFSANLRVNAGPPNAVITADRGSICLDSDAADGNAILYVKTENGTSTGWVPLAQYVAANQVIPVGVAMSWPGTIGIDTVPIGWLYCDGSEQATATYPDLSAFLGSKFGTAAAGNFRLPDYRGITLFGVDGVLATEPGVNVGAATVTLSADQVPEHRHKFDLLPHAHPQPGPAVYSVAGAAIYGLARYDETLKGVEIELPGYDRTHDPAATETEPVGGGQPFSVYQPSSSTNWIIKT